MVAQNTRFNLVSTSVDEQRRSNLNGSTPDLLPWADPYIARLVRRLQAEVRRERAARAHLKKMHEQSDEDFSSPYTEGPSHLDDQNWPLLEE